MDAFGPRPGLDQMAERLAGAGHIVLVPDLFYRHAPYGPYDPKTAFSTPETSDQIRGFLAATTLAMNERDTGDFIKTLTEAGATGKIGTTGYCMGGARSLVAAAAFPDRVAAAASFHGGNLASDAPESPHLRVRTMKARIYVGMAGVDRAFPPEQSQRLEKALREAEKDFIIENYAGMEHGWAVPDHRVFDEKGAERHWQRLLALFDETLH
ncbi:MAG: dienelactone hydrolase family protein [Flavobacteriaceae bacterium]